MNYNQAFFELAVGRPSQLPAPELPEIVFSGRSNVGKSSMINRLLGRKSLARVSASPGKTGTINFYRLPGCRLVDLPGYGYAKVSQAEKEKWGKLIERYLHGSKQLRAVFLLVDIRHEPSANDRMMYDWIVYNGYEPVIIATKLDKLKRSQVPGQVKIIRQALGMGKDGRIIPFSAETKQGRDEIWRLIEVEAGLAAGDDQEQGADGR